MEPKPLGLPIELPILDPDERVVGRMLAELSVSALIEGEGPAGTTDAMFAAIDARTGAPLVSSSMPIESYSTGRFDWDGRTWIGVNRALGSPPLELRMAAPLEPIVALSRARHAPEVRPSCSCL